MARTSEAPPRAVRFRFLALGGLSALVAAGCGTASSAGHPGASSAPQSSAKAPASAATSSTGGTSAAPSSSPAKGGPGPCASGHLSVTLGPSTGAAGSIQQLVTFANISSATCTLKGYPSLQMFDAKGAPIATHVTQGTSVAVPAVAVSTVTLAAGAKGSFLVGYPSQTGYGTASCPTSTTVGITPPGETQPIAVPWKINPYGGPTIAQLQCGDVTVSPVFAGTTAPS